MRLEFNLKRSWKSVSRQVLAPTFRICFKKNASKKIIQTSFSAMLLVAFATLSVLLSGFVFPILNNEQLHPASESASKKNASNKNTN